jgi:hypothetical protein
MVKHGFKCIGTTQKASFWQYQKDPTESVIRMTHEDANDGRQFWDRVEMSEPKEDEEWKKIWEDLLSE